MARNPPNFFSRSTYAPSKAEWSVPTFTEQVFRSRSTQYCLVIPLVNEGTRIRRELTQIHDQGIANLLDVILADGGSTDEALDAPFLQSMGVSALLTKTGPGHLSAQLRMGYAWALVRGYAGIITIDGNGKDSVESIPLFIRALEGGVE